MLSVRSSLTVETSPISTSAPSPQKACQTPGSSVTLSPGSSFSRPAGRQLADDAVGRHHDLRLAVDAAVGRRHEQLEHELAAAAVDDVLGLHHMPVHRRQLVLARDHDLFGVEHARAARQILGAAVAHGEQEQAEFVELALAVVGDVPAEARVEDAGRPVAISAPPATSRRRAA